MLLFFRALFSFPCLCQRVNKNPFLYSLRARPANPTRTTNPMHQRCPLSMLLLHATATWALRPAEAHLSDGFLNPASPCFAPRAHRRRESRGSPHPDNAVTALDHWPLAPSPCSTVTPPAPSPVGAGTLNPVYRRPPARTCHSVASPIGR
jgi:hypothetical protein